MLIDKISKWFAPQHTDGYHTIVSYANTMVQK